MTVSEEIKHRILDFEAPWRSSHAFKKALYQQLCRPDEIVVFNPKLWRILETYNEAFGDNWYYWVSSTGRYVRRTPIWLGKKRIETADHRVKKPIGNNQKKLFEK